MAQTVDMDTVRVSADWDVARPQPFRPLLSFTLSRPLQPTDGRLAIVVDRSDLSALLSVRGTTARQVTQAADTAQTNQNKSLTMWLIVGGGVLVVIGIIFAMRK